MKIPFTKETTSPREILHHSLINTGYGFVAALLPTAIFVAMETGVHFIVFIAAFMFVTFLSMVLNRKAYSTWLGRFVIFPVSYTVGFYAAYRLSFYLKTLI